MGTPLISSENIPRGCDTICRDRHSPRSLSIDSTSDVFCRITVYLGGGPLSSVLMDSGNWRGCHNHRCASHCLRRAISSQSLPRIRHIRSGDESGYSFPNLTAAGCRPVVPALVANSLRRAREAHPANQKMRQIGNPDFPVSQMLSILREEPHFAVGAGSPLPV